MARLASSVSVVVVVVAPRDSDSGEVGDVVVELGDFSGIVAGISRSMDF